MKDLIYGLILMSAGTVCGSLSVFYLKEETSFSVRRILTGFAAGVMTAGCIWCLLLPAMMISKMPASATLGFWGGILMMFAADSFLPHMHVGSTESEGPASNLPVSRKLCAAAMIHNIPEGMAAGAVSGAVLCGKISVLCAFCLAAGIALQNIPEAVLTAGAIRQSGSTRMHSFLYASLTSAAEWASGILALSLVRRFPAGLSSVLSAAAGAMMYIVVEENLPEMSRGSHSNAGPLAFAAGFSLMMVTGVMSGL